MSLARLERLLTTVNLPVGLAWAVSPPASDQRRLFPTEAQAIAKAVPSRKAEFAGGRVAARAALAKLGCMALPIPMGPGRAPVWPQGYVGSVTHTDDMCLAIVGRQLDFVTIGVDLDRDAPLPADVISDVVLHGELLDQGDTARQARRIFSAKEALFKAQYPLTESFIGFQAMHCDLAKGRAEFTKHDENVAIPPLLKANGLPIAQWVADGLVLSVSAVTRHD